MRDYMLLMTGRYQDWKQLSPEENQRTMEAYYAFVENLRAKQRFLGGSPLAQGGYELKGRGANTVIDGPFAETKETLNGYMIFKAENIEEALILAKACPALAHGETVQVFELGNT